MRSCERGTCSSKPKSFFDGLNIKIRLFRANGWTHISQKCIEGSICQKYTEIPPPVIVADIKRLEILISCINRQMLDQR
jgi:hypothetical protein